MFRPEWQARLRRHAGLAVAAAVVAAGLGGAAAPVAAEEVKMYKEAPSAKEMSDVLFGGKKDGGVKFRGITFTGGDNAGKDGAPAAPAESPAIGFNIQFKYGSTEMEDSSRVYIDRVGEMMKLPEAAGQALIVEGHTDAAGSDGYNMDLSRRRAEAVRQYLVAAGIEASRLKAVGKGETDLLDKKDPYSAANRRVQFRRVQ